MYMKIILFKNNFQYIYNFLLISQLFIWQIIWSRYRAIRIHDLDIFHSLETIIWVHILIFFIQNFLYFLLIDFIAFQNLYYPIQSFNNFFRYLCWAFFSICDSIFWLFCYYCYMPGILYYNKVWHIFFSPLSIICKVCLKNSSVSLFFGPDFFHLKAIIMFTLVLFLRILWL